MEITVVIIEAGKSRSVDSSSVEKL